MAAGHAKARTSNGIGTRTVRVLYVHDKLLLLAENVHALEGLACRKRVAPAGSTLAAAPGLLVHALVTPE